MENYLYKFDDGRCLVFPNVQVHDVTLQPMQDLGRFYAEYEHGFAYHGGTIHPLSLGQSETMVTPTVQTV